MKKETALLIGGGLLLYFASRPTVATAINPATGAPYTPGGAGGMVGGLLNSLANLFHMGIPTVTPSNPGIDVINSPGSYPSTPPNYGVYANDSGDPCDPSSVQYNPDICAEMTPQ